MTVNLRPPTNNPLKPGEVILRTLGALSLPLITPSSKQLVTVSVNKYKEKPLRSMGGDYPPPIK